ncbi:NAD(P)-binding protein [Hyaloscypha variabilis F]|uniref:NAD(P)-binding protein n=1 Tax=Hyaloscypha variabilis (strain UAMH 11265 / GT02V1 / F) TaxID=1149755 RepID=A0A2J6QXN9_HYAVF|nr:NAD(P)-binding protein [Hyaloscypha variabilis F]
MATAFRQFVTEQRKELPILATTKNCGGGVFIVTGANVGLGFETAKHLVRLNPLKVILACRNTQAGELAKQDIESVTNCLGIAEVWELDLARYASVKAFAARAIKELGRIDGLIENAGVALDKWSLAEGHETVVTINVIGNFLLAVLLLPKMMASAKQFGVVPHIVLVTSGVAFMMDRAVLAKIQDDVFGGMDDEKGSDMTQRYPLSKLVQIYAGLYFSTLIPTSRTGVVFNLLTPGLFKSQLSRNARFAMRAQVTVANMLFGRTIEMSSRSVLHAVTAGKESHGGYLSNCEVRNDEVPTWVTDENGKQLQKRIWDDLARILNSVEPGCVDRIL